MVGRKREEEGTENQAGRHCAGRWQRARTQHAGRMVVCVQAGTRQVGGV